MTAVLADLLDEVLAGGPGPNVPTTLVDHLRARLEAAAEAAVDGVAPDTLPVRLPKDLLAKVLACEQLAIVTRGPRQLSEPVVRGQILDRLLHHHVHGGGPVVGPALAIAEDAFEAERADDVTAWLLEDPPRRGRLAEDATELAERLRAWGPVPAPWWPRCEDRVRVDLAGGTVICAANLDLVVGGHPTDRPMVVVEAKSGRFTQDHRDGLFWYALLATLRHGTPPAAVIGWSAWDGTGWCQPVTDALLHGAVERAIAALERIGDLARGRTPVRTPSRACGWCPEQATCAVAHRPDGDEADDGD